MKRFHEHRGQHYRIDYGHVQGGFVAVPADAPPMARGTKWAKVVTETTGIARPKKKRGKKG